METIEHKIGETFCLKDGTKLEIAKSTCSCKNCYFFNNKDNHCSKPKNVESCYSSIREDRESIIFKQIKDNNMKEKRNIQISLEEAKEWYNSGNSFKKELALKAYKKEELEETYLNIIYKLPYDTTRKNSIKRDMYIKLLNTAAYVNSIYPKEYYKYAKDYFQYILTKKGVCDDYSLPLFHKGFYINKTHIYYSETFIITFNSEEAAKKAIDILGEELNVLFE